MSGECDMRLQYIVGPIVGVAVLVEAVTICIAVGCCVYLKRRATDRKRYVMPSGCARGLFCTVTLLKSVHLCVSW